MKLTLTKEAEFDFNESKYTAIPTDVFSMLVGEPDESRLSDTALSKIIKIKNKAEYIKKAKLHDIDYNRSIYVSVKGQIFCYLNTFSKDESTNTEESKTE